MWLINLFFKELDEDLDLVVRIIREVEEDVLVIVSLVIVFFFYLFIMYKYFWMNEINLCYWICCVWCENVKCDVWIVCRIY